MSVLKLPFLPARDSSKRSEVLFPNLTQIAAVVPVTDPEDGIALPATVILLENTLPYIIPLDTALVSAALIHARFGPDDEILDGETMTFLKVKSRVDLHYDLKDKRDQAELAAEVGDA